MKTSSLILSVAAISGAFFLTSAGHDRQDYSIIVDSGGVMRRSDTGEAPAYYGTNYTLPFAHAYRAALRAGKDPAEAIKEDVYHISRLGLNAFRLHLWDVELADSLGNIISPNPHLDILDRLIAELEKRGIDIILTAQTNFGNGYPEKDIDTGAFTYDFPKCGIHEDPRAQEIQANYLAQLARHTNPYTGRSYADDNAIIAMEINNEPCHTGSKEEVTAYINRMARTLRDNGFRKPVLYNASHNPAVTEAYYDADVEGVTFQWYPTGLVAGHERKGNHLRALARYPIPWEDTIPAARSKAKVIYEYDPGDVTVSYLYPAATRTLRGAGFQWITQFAYDPMFLAPYNTEYQTHYLNLAYTPGKALGMMIAAETMKELPAGYKADPFPADSVFGNTRVSPALDLADFDNGRKFIHTNNTDRTPVSPDSLIQIAGRGSSPLVAYSGTGAYFLDRIGPDLWRLEIMPDAMITTDPFRKPSPDRKVARTARRSHPFSLSLPSLPGSFFYQGIDEGNDRQGKAVDGTFTAWPGVYLLSGIGHFNGEITDAMREFHAPESDRDFPSVVHEPQFAVAKGDSLTVTATVFGEGTPSAVTIYPEDVSFWRDDNILYPMQETAPHTYTAKIPASDGGRTRYRIVVEQDGEERTFPGNDKGNPLDWDYTGERMYSVLNVTSGDIIPLLIPEEGDERLTVADIPDTYGARLTYLAGNGILPPAWEINPAEKAAENGIRTVLRIYTGKETAESPFAREKRSIGVRTRGGNTDGLTLRAVTRSGRSFSAPLYGQGGEAVVELKDMKAASTLIIPAQFPSFMATETPFSGEETLRPENIEFIEIESVTDKPSAVETIYLR